MLMLQLAVLLGVAVVFGRLAQRCGQPAVVGEILGGLVVGATVLGAVFPGAYEWLFVEGRDVTATREAVVTLGMLFFLFVAGSEVDLREIRHLGPRALSIGLVGTLVPLLAGFGLVMALPAGVWGLGPEASRWPLAVFVGLCLANSANPVLARILMDLGLLKSDVGRVAMAATVVDDLVTWVTFAVLLGSAAPSAAGSGPGVAGAAGLVLLLILAVLAGGRLLARPALRYLGQRSTWPTGFIGCVAVLVLVAAAASDAVGVHAFLGAFLAGIALAGHDPRHQEAHDAMARFTLAFFAPVYFVSMALGTDFVAGFDLLLVAVLTVVACGAKVAGVLAGTAVLRLPVDRTAWTVAWGLNARGATGIVLAGVGRASGIIGDEVFVALVVMALVTTVMAPSLMKLSMRRGSGPSSGGPHDTRAGRRGQESGEPR